MTKHNILYVLSVAGLMISCQSTDDFIGQAPDSAHEITFSTNTEKIITRADAGYEEYDNAKHPTTMGVFGYHDLSADKIITPGKDNPMFHNQEVDYDQESKSWKYTPLQYWGAYAAYTSFDFFAYMPYMEAGPQLTASDNSYTLRFPVDLSEKKGILTESQLKDNAPLICQAPVHKSIVGEVITYNMDQTLTGYNIQFQLGVKMDAIRDFIIKSVKLYSSDDAGNAGKIPVKGTVSRTYLYNNEKWTSDPIQWNVTESATVAQDAAYEVAYKNNSKSPAPDDYVSPYTNGQTTGTGTLRLNSTEYLKWGENFYSIPYYFTPTIEVTYDVVVQDDGNDNADLTTRENVTSTIVFKKENFPTYTGAGTTGKINPIKIKIVPSYLYVLADADKTAGYIILNNQ